jgi:hypothetical protein
VRQLFGYDRFDDPKLVSLMNDLYANEFSLLTNFFYPTLKLKSKSRVGSRWVKKYSTGWTGTSHSGSLHACAEASANSHSGGANGVEALVL